jgi:hypothetical protein
MATRRIARVVNQRLLAFSQKNGHPRKSHALSTIASANLRVRGDFKVRISALPSVIPDRNNVVPKSYWTGRQDWVKLAQEVMYASQFYDPVPKVIY